jgi:hypothetical protein
LQDEAEEESKTKGTRNSDNQIKRGFRAHSSRSRFGANAEAQVHALCVTFCSGLLLAFSAADFLATGRAVIPEPFGHLPGKITRRSVSPCSSSRSAGMGDNEWPDRAREERQQWHE